LRISDSLLRVENGRVEHGRSVAAWDYKPAL
jgi:hypothetical protein